ncbi:hypothetical protein AWM75_04330 [Aerococcus urinaehominis]|uniref:Uncharacterized protein n=1 Tax=Aerococcus urinaehominis TaxID=128944 RepID=A0A0X8FLH4_9LACT|nr:hypothetical protein [Aerococcus urinaehominis]AMB99274.1 hypothetical protein AWM75_04330 [Aerococcus urinaehominis]SDM47432.1 hypothetical protein SAMN04487985_11834 [Aerococcus urinaehominis]
MQEAAKYMRIYVWMRSFINLIGITSFAWDIFLVAAVDLFTNYDDFHQKLHENKSLIYAFSQFIWRGYVFLTGLGMFTKLLRTGQLIWQASDVLYELGFVAVLSLPFTIIIYIAIRRGDI